MTQSVSWMHEHADMVLHQLRHKWECDVKGRSQSNLGIHVCAVEVDLAAVLVDEITHVLHIVLEHTAG